MKIDELIPGRLYKTSYSDAYFVFVEKLPDKGIKAHYFADNRLVGRDYPITNIAFWEMGEEISFPEAPDYILEHFPHFKEKEINYQIF